MQQTKNQADTAWLGFGKQLQAGYTNTWPAGHDSLHAYVPVSRDISMAAECHRSVSKLIQNSHQVKRLPRPLTRAMQQKCSADKADLNQAKSVVNRSLR
ncbi:MAG: hypothetical protein EP344_00540 [Bacteroidetes bacterium]|nr:MAG: hypothetical protein EP344_00540 [Bacteroidota bacterium]